MFIVVFMNWSEVFNPKFGNVIVTVIIISFAFLFDLFISWDWIQWLVIFLISYVFSSLVMYSIFGPKLKGGKLAAFDAGGVYFEGDYFTDDLEPRKGMNELISKLRQQMTVIMLTNQNKTVNQFLISEFKLDSVFDAVISSGDVKVRKPEPKIFEFILEKYGVMPSNVYFVDDQKPNVDSALRLGINAIHFQSVEQLRDELKELGVRV